MKNKELKIDIIQNHGELINIYNKYKYLDMVMAFNDISEELYFEMYKDKFLYYDLIHRYPKKYLEECERILNNNYKKLKRLKDHIQSILESEHGQFVTLTFSDEVLESTSEQTRRRYITRFLKEVSNKYVANIDYGKENEREHYHAVIEVKDEYKRYSDIIKLYDKMLKSISYIEDIKYNNKHSLAKYVVKLSNHAIKDTTYLNKTIYSKSYA